jgi:metal-responsive CopG/Arc/MetJ family transcriptional regulator
MTHPSVPQVRLLVLECDLLLEQHATRSRSSALSDAIITYHLHHETGEAVFDVSR